MEKVGTLDETGNFVFCPACAPPKYYAITEQDYGRMTQCLECGTEFLIPTVPAPASEKEMEAGKEPDEGQAQAPIPETPPERKIEPPGGGIPPGSAAAAPTAILDCRPILRREATVIWAKVEDVRDSVYMTLVNACAEHKIQTHVLRSGPYAFPATVAVDCWQPYGSPLVTERSHLEVTINPVPYHQYEIEYDISLHARGKDRSYYRLWNLPERDLSAVVSYMLRRGALPRLEEYTYRRWFFQFWKPKNKPTAFQKDYLWMLNTALWLAGLLGIWFYPKLWLLWFIAIPLTIYLWRRPKLVRSSGKPAREPRQLLTGDLWHTVLFGIGGEVQYLKERFFDQLQGAAQNTFRFSSEKISYRGLDDLEEREQIAISMGRALVYCQIYQYQDDLYVGWDGHLNMGQWEERNIASGIDRETGLPAVITVVTPSFQTVSEYDLADLNFITEWIHAHLVNLLKQLIAEKHIDQEIDFHIIRGDRSQFAERQGPTSPLASGRALNPLARFTSFSNALMASFKRTR